MIHVLDKVKSRFEEKNIEYTVKIGQQALSEQDLINLIPLFDGIILGDDPMNESVLKVAENLKVIAKWGIGTDNIDFEVAKKNNIKITNTPGLLSNSVADLGFGMLLTLIRNIHIVDEDIRNNKWPKYVGIELSDKKLGIIGFGNIGKAVGRRGLGFAMNPYFYDPFVSLFLLIK